MKYQELHTVKASYKIPAESLKCEKPSDDNIAAIEDDFYPKKDADEAIKELVDDNHILINQIKRQQKSETLSYGIAFHYRQELDKARYTLWITRAIRAKESTDNYHNIAQTHLNNGNSYMFKKCFDVAEKFRVVESKCRKKAEAYK